LLELSLDSVEVVLGLLPGPPGLAVLGLLGLEEVLQFLELLGHLLASVVEVGFPEVLLSRVLGVLDPEVLELSFLAGDLALQILPHHLVLLDRVADVLWEHVLISLDHASDPEVALAFLLLLFQKFALHVHEVDLLEKVLNVLILEVHVGIHPNAFSVEPLGILSHDTTFLC